MIISNHLSLTTSKLIKRTEDYQMQLAEWEKHLQEITYKLAKLEEENSMRHKALPQHRLFLPSK